MNDDFGDRMKGLEQIEAGRKLDTSLPICVRIDGKGFSKWTKGLNRPYDERLSALMVRVTKRLVEETNACIGYTQSDEISLVLYTASPESQVFFDGKVQKLTSVIASMATAFFNEEKCNHFPDKPSAIFDARVWNVPDKVEAANTILWREQDAAKNSISMAARHYFSHKELQGKSGSEMKAMMLEKNVDWEDYPSFFKRGTFIRRFSELRMLTQEELEKIPEIHRPTGPIQRSTVRELSVPKFSSVKNRAAVIFHGEEPEILVFHKQ